MKPAENNRRDRIRFLNDWLIEEVNPSLTLLFQRIMNIDNNAIIISVLISYIQYIQLKSREFFGRFTGRNVIAVCAFLLVDTNTF